MKNMTWDIIRLGNSRHLNMPEIVSDYTAVQSIINLCVSGLSNFYIGQRLDMDTEYIQEVLEEFLSFSGWDDSLDFSPAFFYELCEGSLASYMETIQFITPYYADDLDLVLDSFTYCRIHENMVKIIEDFYEGESQ